MKDLTKRFLSESDRAKIIDAVKTVERYTSGEIVPMIVSSSYHYPMANVIGGITFSLPLSLIFTPLLGGWLWIGTQNMWLLIGVLSVLFVIFHQTVKHVAWLKRLFISKREIEEEVEEAAVTSFFKEGLYQTRDKTGVLIYISVFEHHVWVLADKGINERVAQIQWDAVVKLIVKGIKEKTQAAAIVEAVVKVGDLLKEHFPIKSDDRDELKNLIIEEK